MKEEIRMKQLRNNLEYILYGYMNGMMDFPESYPKMNDEQTVAYVYDQLFDIKDNGMGGTIMKTGICDDLKFLGTEIIISEILIVADECGILAN